MKLVIPGELTDLNTYINAERSNRYPAAAIKRDETARVAGYAREQVMEPFTGGILQFCWFTKDTRKDADNIAFATKFILDGLKLAGVIETNGRKVVTNLFHCFFVVDTSHP